MLDFSYILYLLMQALAVIVGLCVHESAHALAAWALGDKTARSRGRVSLNPLAHIDPFGTVLLPLIMIVLGGPVFAFAKPVPVYLNNLKHPKRDEVLVALAGPASNLLLACLAALLKFPRMQMPILIIVLYLVPQVLRIDLVGIYFNFTVYPLFDLLTGLALG